MMLMFTKMARSLLRTLESMATPCSVNAIGAYRKPLRSALEVTVCDLQVANSSGLSSNMKSAGKRTALRRTACFNALVGTP